MAKKTFFLPLLVISLLFISFDAQSNVLIEDAREATNVSNNTINVTSGTIETGDGGEGDYVIIACANDFTNGSDFNTPTPLNWTLLDEGSCVSLNEVVCSHSIWGGFVSDPNSQTITCGWTPATVLFVAGSMRYTDVDPDNPIIDVECNAGQGDSAIAPSIITEAGSQVLRVWTFGTPLNQQTTNNDTSTRAETEDAFLAAAGSTEFQRVLGIGGLSQLFLNPGPTDVSALPQIPQTNWRACTIGIRMLPSRDIPTMSEWGLIGFAAFAGIAGVWYLRRRQATA